jgi:hypothetical protein
VLDVARPTRAGEQAVVMMWTASPGSQRADCAALARGAMEAIAWLAKTRLCDRTADAITEDQAREAAVRISPTPLTDGNASLPPVRSESNHSTSLEPRWAGSRGSMTETDVRTSLRLTAPTLPSAAAPRVSRQAISWTPPRAVRASPGHSAIREQNMKIKLNGGRAASEEA